MADYTPTTEEVRTAACSEDPGGYSIAEFDRWLAEVRAEGEKVGRDSMADYLIEQGWTNPAQIETMIEEAREEGAAWMREQADAELQRQRERISARLEECRNGALGVSVPGEWGRRITECEAHLGAVRVSRDLIAALPVSPNPATKEQA